MRNRQSIIKYLGIWTVRALLLFSQLSSVFGQLPPEIAQFGYPETIFLNGKVVSMDDGLRSTDVGNIYHAVAVKDDKIMKRGTPEQVRALAGPDTQIFDLKGRTLIPGIIEPHSHMYGRVVQLLLQASLASEFGVDLIGPVCDFSDEEVAAQYLGDN